MISKKTKDRPGGSEELQLLIERMDSENTALNKILDCIQPGSSALNGVKKGKNGNKKSKLKSI